MGRLIIPLLLAALVAPAFAVDVQLLESRDLPTRTPSGLCDLGGVRCVFDPLAQIFVALESGRQVPAPIDRSWTAVASHNGQVVALTLAGGVETWNPAATQPVAWPVVDAIDLAVGLDVVWLLHRDGSVTRHDPVSGSEVGAWPQAWSRAGKIDVSETLEQIVLAPVQGREVRLYDTSGLLLRTVEGPQSARCAGARLGPGGVLALADRYQGEIALYGPLGEHLGQIANRGQGPGEVLRPAALSWSGANLQVVDPALRRLSVYGIAALDGAILPVPLLVAPAGGLRLSETEVELVVAPQRYNIVPDWIEIELGHLEGASLALDRLPLASDLDTLRHRPAVTLEPATDYRWRVRAGAADVNSGWSAWSHFSTAALPDRFELLPNYPNPFNAATVIPLQVPDVSDRRVRIEIFNVVGQRVRTLLDAEPDPGARTVVWDGRDDRGGQVASGAYFVRLLYKEGQLVRKAVMLK